MVRIAFLNCSVEKTLTFVIVKADNPMTVKGKTVTMKHEKLLKKDRTIKRSKAITVSKARGAVSYKLAGVTKSKYKKFFKVNAKSGLITVKKGIPAGNYKVKVKVKAAGNANYKASPVKTVTVKVVVESAASDQSDIAGAGK